MTKGEIWTTVYISLPLLVKALRVAIERKAQAREQGYIAKSLSPQYLFEDGVYKGLFPQPLTEQEQRLQDLRSDERYYPGWSDDQRWHARQREKQGVRTWKTFMQD